MMRVFGEIDFGQDSVIFLKIKNVVSEQPNRIEIFRQFYVKTTWKEYYINKIRIIDDYYYMQTSPSSPDEVCIIEYIDQNTEHLKNKISNDCASFVPGVPLDLKYQILEKICKYFDEDLVKLSTLYFHMVSVSKKLFSEDEMLSIYEKLLENPNYKLRYHNLEDFASGPLFPENDGVLDKVVLLILKKRTDLASKIAILYTLIREDSDMIRVYSDSFSWNEFVVAIYNLSAEHVNLSNNDYYTMKVILQIVYDKLDTKELSNCKMEMMKKIYSKLENLDDGHPAFMSNLREFRLFLKRKSVPKERLESLRDHLIKRLQERLYDEEDYLVMLNILDSF